MKTNFFSPPPIPRSTSVSVAPGCDLEKKISPLRQRMIEDMNLHGYAPSTKEVFLKSVLELGKFFKKKPGDITEDELRKYFLMLKNDETQSPQDLSFRVYGVVLDKN